MLITLFVGFYGLIALAVLMELLIPKRSMAFKTMTGGLILFTLVLFVLYLVFDMGARFG